MIGCTLGACGRWSAGSEQATRDKLFADAVNKWQVDAQARRYAADRQKERDQAVDARTIPPLVEAAQVADVAGVKALLASGVDRETLNDALILASRSEPLAVDVSTRQEVDASPQYAETARLLLDKGANLEFRNKDGSFPLLRAAGNGETAVVKLFLDRGAKVDATDQSGQTPLIAAACNCPTIDMPDTADSVRLLLKSGANIEARNKDGDTALMNAAGWGRSRIIEILLDKGPQIEARNHEGNTALLLAARGQGYPTADAVQMLLTRGANIEARNNKGETPLMLAASGGGFEDAKIVTMLLNRGANPRAKNLNGRTAYDLAVAKRRAEAASLLRSAASKSH